MYVYLPAGVAPDTLPAPLRQRTGVLTRCLTLDLGRVRRLARVDRDAVVAALRDPGYFLQLPPSGQLRGVVHDGD